MKFKFFCSSPFLFVIDLYFNTRTNQYHISRYMGMDVEKCRGMKSKLLKEHEY